MAWANSPCRTRMSCQTALEGVGPELKIGLGVDELGGDPHLVSGAQQRTFNHGFDTQLFGNLCQGLVGLLKAPTRVARDHFEVFDFGEFGDQDLGHASGQVVLLFVTGEVGERQDRQAGDLRCLCGCLPALLESLVVERHSDQRQNPHRRGDGGEPPPTSSRQQTPRVCSSSRPESGVARPPPARALSSRAIASASG